MADVMELDMSNIREPWRGAKMQPPRTKPQPSQDKKVKQARARARRKIRKGEMLMREGLEAIWKPIEEWDDEELARGRPRSNDGTFSGRKPGWVTPEIHEAALDRFKTIIREGTNAATHKAVAVVVSILENDEVDRRGKPIVPATTKFAAATFLIEHVLGKPKQHTEVDISVKLQGLLATAMIMPGQSMPALADGVIEAEVIDDDEAEEDE
jgi:hypothetical protein